MLVVCSVVPAAASVTCGPCNTPCAAQQRELAAEKDSLVENASLIGHTMEGLLVEIDKSRLLVQNFAPHLLTTEDFAIGSS